MLARTGRHPCDIHAIARMCGVKLHDSADNRSSGRKPGHCFCKPTVRAIGRRHGESHLAMVLKVINSTDNGRELHAATLQAGHALAGMVYLYVKQIRHALSIGRRASRRKVHIHQRG